MRAADRFRNLPRILEITANSIIIIVCAVLLGGMITGRFGKQNGPRVESGWLRGAGAPQLPGLDYSKARQTLILVLKSSCSFCQESTPFYRELAETTSRSGRTQLVAVFPKEDADAFTYLQGHNITVRQVFAADLSSIHARATPTLLLIDGAGRVKNFWVGVISKTEQKAVLKDL